MQDTPLTIFSTITSSVAEDTDFCTCEAVRRTERRLRRRALLKPKRSKRGDNASNHPIRIRGGAERSPGALQHVSDKS